MARAFVYIDGFNLYYRALRGTAFKWLNPCTLVSLSMPDGVEIERVNYYTARVSGRLDPEAPKRQHAYLQALATLPTLKIHYGNFLATQKWSGLVKPPTFRPAVTLDPGIEPNVAYVWKTEEKGSDVNLGVHLVRDAALKAFDVAAVLTNDTDLVEPIRIATQEFGRAVTLLTPTNRPAASLKAVATHVRHITPYLGPAQFDEPVVRADGREIKKPEKW